MARCLIAAFLFILPGYLLAAGPGYGLGAGMGAGVEGGGYGVMGGGDPCDRGTIFTALKVVKAYRDNAAFAFKHFEGKELEISGRLIGVKRDKIIVNDQVVFDGFVALVTPDGKPPKPTGLEFRFPISALQNDPQFACDVAALWAGQFVTLKGKCIGAFPEGEYVGVVFDNASIVR